MTKDEILNEIHPQATENSYFKTMYLDSTKEAMDIYAKQEAIAFAKFAMENTWQDLNDDNEWRGNNYETLTDDELYNKYLLSVEKTPH
jgi:hypothetical protein